jgi:hypothetical protein
LVGWFGDGSAGGLRKRKRDYWRVCLFARLEFDAGEDQLPLTVDDVRRSDVRATGTFACLGYLPRFILSSIGHGEDLSIPPVTICWTWELFD